MKVQLFDYELPQEAIAQHPVEPRDAARLLVWRRAEGVSQDRRVSELAELLEAGDLVVVNDTRVLPARLLGRRASGGAVELLLLERAGSAESAGAELSGSGSCESWVAMLRPAARLKPGEEVELEDGALSARMLERRLDAQGRPGAEWRVELRARDGAGAGQGSVLELIERHGHMPLPPYIQRDPAAQADAERDRLDYQTMFARERGAVAAPTAGLHFTPRLVQALEQRSVELASLTLHVGAGTFRPVKVADTDEHAMHVERYELPVRTVEAIDACRARGGRVVALGTTSLRVLEACADEAGKLQPGRGATDLFITPGYRFRCVDALMTNFHLPCSTLLMLVAAFCGRERVLALYRRALAEGYRFYSYGDAMLLT